MSGSRTELFVHLVWATAQRAPIIAESIEAPLYALLAEKCRKLQCPPLAIGGIADHVHVLVSLSPLVSVASLAKELKGASAHGVNHRLEPGVSFAWQAGYGAFSLRGDDVATVRRYVLQQKEHHTARTSRDEWEQDGG